jgi:uncharacterized membrane protein YdjX (TVP38/TMEM64 family)
MMPATIMTLGGAYTFATVYSNNFFLAYFIALGTVVLSATIGGFLAFLIGRFLLRKFITKYIIDKVKILIALNSAISNNGLKIVMLMRINPIVPYNFFNYGMSVTAIKPKDFFLGTISGIIPMASIYVYVGVNLKSISEVLAGEYHMDAFYTVAIILGGILLIALIVYLVKISRDELKKILAE